MRMIPAMRTIQAWPCAAFGGGLIVAAGMAMIDAVLVSLGYQGGLESVAVAALLLAAILLLALGLRAVAEGTSFSCDHVSFAFAKSDLSGRSETTYWLASYEGLVRREGVAMLQMANGELVQIPEHLQPHADRIADCLEEARNWNQLYLSGNQLHPSLPPSQHWPDPFRSRMSAPPLCDAIVETKIEDPIALRALIAQYRKTVLFREGLPPAYDLAKMFMTLRNSNGGLVLFGVSPDGALIGLEAKELARARQRLEHLAAKLTAARVEIGRIELDGKFAAFAVFNPIPRHTRPLELFEKATSEVVVV
jgi:hypothetical protein